MLSITPGIWQTLSPTNPASGTSSSQNPILLSDGTIMVHDGTTQVNNAWFRLTPDASGNYATGTWSSLASMSVGRAFFPSAVLPDGRVLVVGGEYSTPFDFTNTAEIFDPTAGAQGTWTSVASVPTPATDVGQNPPPKPTSQFGDDPIEVLPNGQVLAGYFNDGTTYRYNPATNSWTTTSSSKVRGDASDEETWVKLPGGSILSYDIFASETDGKFEAQRYIPSQDKWVDASTLDAANPPSLLSGSNVGQELGPGFLLPDGRVIMFGANGNTAYYNPATNIWSAGPSEPTKVIGGVATQLVMADAPGAMMPNGDVLLGLSPEGSLDSQGNYTFPTPAFIYEFNPTTGQFADVTPADGLPLNSDFYFMLVLPSGQVLLDGYQGPTRIYTPSGSPNPSWAPAITNVANSGSGTFILTGTQLNGISEGANFGDDMEMASNYPIVRLTSQSGAISYARTFNWSSTDVATGNTLVTVEFTLPPADAPGIYGVTVIANGIPSAEVQENLTPTLVSISDVAQLEGDVGLTNFVFTVTRSGNLGSTTTVAFSTADGTATVALGDYLAQAGTLTFVPGETSKLITVEVVGNTIPEPNETFFVQLSNPTNAMLGRAQAVGTILNDDDDISISDVTVVQPRSGTTNAVFTISAFGVVLQNISVGWATADGTATSFSDYLPQSGTVTFPPSGGTANITVPIVGDSQFESPESFDVVLSNAVHGRIVKGIGVCTVLNPNLQPALYVNDIQVKSTQSGVLNAVFTVALDTASGDVTTVQFATVDGGARAGTNYTPTSGTLTFAPGLMSQFVTVPVMTSATYAPNEQFYLNLSNPVHAKLATPQGTATIVFATAPSGETIVDDGDPNFSETAGWVNLTNTAAYQLDFEYHTPGDGSGAATWSFPNLATGAYQVFAHWVPFMNRATNAPFTILDGSTPLGTVSVNEQLAPSGDLANGITWQSLGTFTTSSGMLAVRLNDNANGYVIADAIRVVAGVIAATAPQMNASGGGLSIPDRIIASTLTGPSFDNATDFGDVAATTNSATHTFTITNTGDADLHLTGAPRVTISGVDAQDFTVLTQPASTIGPGATSTFQVIFHPSDVGLRQAVISIANDDANKSPYTFDVQGTGTTAGPMNLVLDDSMVGYTQTGAWVTSANSHAVQGEMRSDGGGAGNDKATWSFAGLAPGNYTVYATWVPFINRATNAPFTIADGSATQATVSVDQQQEPSDLAAAGTMWKSLASLQLSTGALSITLSNQANGFVIADAVYLVRNDPPAAPVIAPSAPPGNSPSNPPAVNFAHNAALPQDVNGDGHVSSLDALLVIDHLLDAGITNNAAPNATAQAVTSNSYLDVNGDGIVSPIDALLVIDYLDNQTSQPNAVGAAVASPSVSAAAPASSAANSPAINSPVSSPAALAAAAVDQAIVQLSGTQPSAASPVDAGPPPIPLSSPVSAGTPPAVASSAVAATGLLTPATVRTFFGASDTTFGGTSVVDRLDD